MAPARRLQPSAHPKPHKSIPKRIIRDVSSCAKKGFGGFSLPKLPSISNAKKAPAGGVPPLPPQQLDYPPDLARLWSAAHAEWLDYAVRQPVLLPSYGAAVHLVPVGADQPADAALIRDVVSAVQPDAIALESPPQHLKAYTALARAAEPHLAALLAACPAPPAPLAPAPPRAVLPAAAREALQDALLAACRASAAFQPDHDQLTHMFALGAFPFVEWLTAAHLARGPAGGGAAAGRPPPLLVSCGLDRAARAALGPPSLLLGREFDVYVEEVEAAVEAEAGAALAAWRIALGDGLEGAGALGGEGRGRELAGLLAGWEAARCLGPAAQARVAGAVEARVAAEERERREAARAGRGQRFRDRVAREGQAVEEEDVQVPLEVVRTPADGAVAARLVGLAAGRDVVRPCRVVVALVGRPHVGGVEAELRRLAEGA